MEQTKSQLSQSEFLLLKVIAESPSPISDVDLPKFDGELARGLFKKGLINGIPVEGSDCPQETLIITERGRRCLAEHLPDEVTTEIIKLFVRVGIFLDVESATRFKQVLLSMKVDSMEPEPNLYIERFGAPHGSLRIEIPRIPISSYCRHHLLPWLGYVYVRYTPGKYILGLSKFKRLADYCSRGLTLQEEVCRDIQEKLVEVLETPVEVEIRATHTCAIVRGVKLDPSFEFVVKVV